MFSAYVFRPYNGDIVPCVTYIYLKQLYFLINGSITSLNSMMSKAIRKRSIEIRFIPCMYFVY